MTDIHVTNVTDLKQFASSLAMLAENMVESFAQANSAAQYVSEGWRDKQNEQFMEQFRQATDAIKRIAGIMTEHSEYIRRYADYVERASSIR